MIGVGLSKLAPKTMGRWANSASYGDEALETASPLLKEGASVFKGYGQDLYRQVPSRDILSNIRKLAGPDIESLNIRPLTHVHFNDSADITTNATKILKAAQKDVLEIPPWLK